MRRTLPILALALALGCGGVPTTQKATTQKPEPAFDGPRLTVAQLERAFREDLEQARGQYDGQHLQVSGLVVSINPRHAFKKRPDGKEERLPCWWLNLASKADSRPFLACIYWESAPVQDIKPGQEVTLLGKLDFSEAELTQQVGMDSPKILQP